MHYQRNLDIKSLIQKKSFFLFGPRSVGKTSLLKYEFKLEQIINLLRSEIYLRLATNPSELHQMVDYILQVTGDKIVIIDEIQKLPILLDEVHELIESKNISFILTGSSARKLKRGGVNLLAGRAWQANLFPLTSHEIEDFSLEKYLLLGGLPQVYTSSYPNEELDAYINTYLKEEIKEEALVQNFINFSRFLKLAAFTNGQQLNYASVASDTGIPANTVRQYFDILEETFIGFTLFPWKESQKRKSIAIGKFYFFDIGVAHFLRGIKELNAGSDDFGRAFEHFIALELRAYLSYSRSKKQMYFWRTKSKVEVDFIIDGKIAIEVKASAKISDKYLKGLRYLKEENMIDSFFLVSLDKVERITADGIQIMHWQSFLTKLWDGGLC
jgi:predicted AAA+ superfamily ATPase